MSNLFQSRTFVSWYLAIARLSMILVPDQSRSWPKGSPYFNQNFFFKMKKKSAKGDNAFNDFFFIVNFAGHLCINDGVDLFTKSKTRYSYRQHMFLRCDLHQRRQLIVRLYYNYSSRAIAIRHFRVNSKPLIATATTTNCCIWSTCD